MPTFSPGCVFGLIFCTYVFFVSNCGIDKIFFLAFSTHLVGQFMFEHRKGLIPKTTHYKNSYDAPCKICEFQVLRSSFSLEDYQTTPLTPVNHHQHQQRSKFDQIYYVGDVRRCYLKLIYVIFLHGYDYNNKIILQFVAISMSDLSKANNFDKKIC